jgi:hypothetical protein
MDFVGRDDPVRKLRAWLGGEGLKSPVSVISVSGPGGIGKTFLLEHAIRTSGIESRNYLRLRVGGVAGPRTLGQIVCHDLLQSCTQVDATGKSFFIETRKNLEALRVIDARARAEVEAQLGADPALKQTVMELFRFGAGLQSALPVLKRYVDVSKVKEEHVDAVLGLLEKTRRTRRRSACSAAFSPICPGADAAIASVRASAQRSRRGSSGTWRRSCRGTRARTRRNRCPPRCLVSTGCSSSSTTSRAWRIP